MGSGLPSPYLFSALVFVPLNKINLPENTYARAWPLDIHAYGKTICMFPLVHNCLISTAKRR